MADCRRRAYARVCVAGALGCAAQARDARPCHRGTVARAITALGGLRQAEVQGRTLAARGCVVTRESGPAVVWPSRNQSGTARRGLDDRARYFQEHAG